MVTSVVSGTKLLHGLLFEFARQLGCACAATVVPTSEGRPTHRVAQAFIVFSEIAGLGVTKMLEHAVHLKGASTPTESRCRFACRIAGSLAAQAEGCAWPWGNSRSASSPHEITVLFTDARMASRAKSQFKEGRRRFGADGPAIRSIHHVQPVPSVVVKGDRTVSVTPSASPASRRKSVCPTNRVVQWMKTDACLAVAKLVGRRAVRIVARFEDRYL